MMPDTIACDEQWAADRPTALARGLGTGNKRGTGTRDPGIIGFTVPEIRRLLVSLIQACAPDPPARLVLVTLATTTPARLCHCQRRGYALT